MDFCGLTFGFSDSTMGSGRGELIPLAIASLIEDIIASTNPPFMKFLAISLACSFVAPLASAVATINCRIAPSIPFANVSLSFCCEEGCCLGCGLAFGFGGTTIGISCLGFAASFGVCVGTGVAFGFSGSAGRVINTDSESFSLTETGSMIIRAASAGISRIGSGRCW